MRIAIPVVNGQLSQHFGHAGTFALLDVDPETKTITEAKEVPAPDHVPGLLPAWLKEQGADVIITGGMGTRAQALFQEASIEVVLGAPSGDPQAVALDYLNGALTAGSNICDH